MTKVLIDTNVVLDALTSRAPFHESAKKIFLLVADNAIEGFITASSLTDIYYIARKSLPESATREALRYLLSLFSVISVTGEDCAAALELAIDDYEDALLETCAFHAGVAYIVSRDQAFLNATTPTPVISPAQFLAQFSSVSTGEGKPH